MLNMSNGKHATDIAVLKDQVQVVRRWIENADVNHFPTIERRFDGIEKKLAYYSGTIVAASATVQLVIKYLL